MRLLTTARAPLPAQLPMHHSEFRIEKERLPVVVVTTAGDRMFGDMFVQAYIRHRSGREEPSDIMNGPEPFFPLAVASGEMVLIAKEWVREVEIVGEAGADDAAMASKPATVEITVSAGRRAPGGFTWRCRSTVPACWSGCASSTDRFDH